MLLARDGRIYFHQEQEQERERPVEEIAVFANDLDLIFEFKKNMRHKIDGGDDEY